MASSSASAVPSASRPHSAYEAPVEILQSLTPCEIALRNKLEKDINRIPLEEDYSRCFHSTDMVAAFNILANGLRPSELYNARQGRYNLAAGAFFTKVSPLAFGFPKRGWLQRLLNNNYGKDVEGDQPKNDWVRSRGEVCMMLDLPEHVLRDAAEEHPAYKKEGRNVFYLDVKLFKLFERQELPAKKISFAFRTVIDAPSAEVARVLDGRLAEARKRGDAFEMEWLRKLVAAPPQQSLDEDEAPLEAVGIERAVQKLRPFWPEQVVEKAQKVLLDRSEKLELHSQLWSGDERSAVALLLETPLQELYLWYTGIGPLGAAALAEALAQSRCSLRTLNLNVNRIGGEGASKLGEALQCNSRLQLLVLDHNEVGDLGAVALGEGLLINSTLVSLWLTGNRIGHRGAVALAQALPRNSALQQLGLGANSIGEQGAAALGEGLRRNGTLQRLWLWSNAVGSKGATALGQGLQHNTSLQALDLERNNLSDADKSALRAPLRHIPKLLL